MRKYVAFPELPESERAIGARVREARKRAKLSQAKIAALIGLTRDQVNNVELGRAALRFRPGWDLCVELDLNPAWLLTGEGERHGLVVVGGLDLAANDDLFTEVMGSLCKKDFQWPVYVKYREENLKGVWSMGVLSVVKAGSFRRPPAKLGQDQRSGEPILSDSWNQISPKHRGDFLRFMHRAARSFIRAQDHNRMELLTKQLRFGKVGSMNLWKTSLWPNLREKIRRLVRRRGMKSALARDIGVSRQAINALLSRKGTHGPSAEYALRLLKWVEIADSKQKQSVGGLTPAPKAQKAKSARMRKQN